MGAIDNFVLNWGAGDRELPNNTNSYTITQLEAGREYTIYLTASNAAGSITEQFTASTTEPKKATSSATAALGGVLAVVVVAAAVIITVLVIVIVILLKKLRRAEGID